MGDLEIIGGPTPIPVLRAPGDIYRWKVQNGRAEQHVYVQIADLFPNAIPGRIGETASYYFAGL